MSTPEHLVRFIAGQHGMATQLITAHHNDGTGHCAVCSAGAQTWRYTWPCQLRSAAVEARDMIVDW